MESSERGGKGGEHPKTKINKNQAVGGSGEGKRARDRVRINGDGDSKGGGRRAGEKGNSESE